MADMWYYTCEGKQMEPVTTAELQQLAASGFLRPADMLWKEGMANWVKAGTMTEMFPGGLKNSPAAVSAASKGAAVPVSKPRSRDADEEPERKPRRRERDDDDDDDGDRDERPRRRRKEPASGTNRSWVIGLSIGGGVLALLIVGLVIWLVVRGGSSTVATYTVDLAANGFHSRDFQFQARRSYEFTVNSNQNTDVDIYIENMAGQIVAGDSSVGPNSLVRWSPAVSGNYRVKIINLDFGIPNQSHVVIRDLGSSRGPFGNAPPMIRRDVKMPAPVINPPFGQVGPIIAPPQLPHTIGPSKTDTPPPLNPGQPWETTVIYPVPKMVEVVVNSNNSRNDVDLWINQVGFNPKGGQAVNLSDTAVSPSCRLVFQAQANQPYRFRVMNLGPFPANCTVTYTAP